jgi:hypothetical protein
MSETLIVGGWYSTEISGYLKSARDCQVSRNGSAMIYTIWIRFIPSQGHSSLANSCTQHSPNRIPSTKN